MSQRPSALYVRDVATWIADDGAPWSVLNPGPPTRLGRMTNHVATALPSVSPGAAWVFGSAMGPFPTVGAALGLTGSTPVRPEDVSLDAVAEGLPAAHKTSPVAAVAAGHATVAMAFIEAVGWIVAGHEEVVVVCAEESVPKPLSPTLPYEPLAVAIHVSAEPRPGDWAVLHGPTHQRVPPRGPVAGPQAGNPCAPALELARAIKTSASVLLPLEAVAAGEAAETTSAWCMRVEPAPGMPA